MAFFFTPVGDVGLEGVIEFLRAAGRLKSISRTGWVESGIDTPESVADHCFRTALLAMVLADLQGLDAEKVIKMALLHDVAEAETGDLTPEQKRRLGDFTTNEDKAMTKLLSMLPKPLAENYRSLWEEYHHANSPEAEAVAQADVFEMLLQALEYEEVGVEPSALDRFWDAYAVDGLPSILREALMKKRGR
jgi:putative hydrolase of HD superfamily